MGENGQPSGSILLLARALQAMVDDTVQASEERMADRSGKIIRRHREELDARVDQIQRDLETYQASRGRV